MEIERRTKKDKLTMGMTKREIRIEWKEETSYLRVLIDRKLIWRRHFVWGQAAKNIIKLQRIQNNALRRIMEAPCYIKNTKLRRDLKINTREQHINTYTRSEIVRI